jgi:hypothetical protein
MVPAKERPSYETPKVIDLATCAKGTGDCANGTSVLDTCGTGDVVIPGCNAGVYPTILCDTGGNFV